MRYSRVTIESTVFMHIIPPDLHIDFLIDTFWGLGHELKTVFNQGGHAQSLALSKHHYSVKPSFSVPLAVLGQGGGGGITPNC